MEAMVFLAGIGRETAGHSPVEGSLGMGKRADDGKRTRCVGWRTNLSVKDILFKKTLALVG